MNELNFPLLKRPWNYYTHFNLSRVFNEHTYLIEKYGSAKIQHIRDEDILEKDKDYYTIIRFNKILFKINSNYPNAVPYAILSDYKHENTRICFMYYLTFIIDNKINILKFKKKDLKYFDFNYDQDMWIDLIKVWNLNECIYKLDIDKSMSRLEMYYIYIELVTKKYKQLLILYLNNKIFENLGLKYITFNDYYPIGYNVDIFDKIIQSLP